MITVLAIAGGFAVWAVVHSVLASQSVKSWAQHLIGPGIRRWYRLGFVILATVTLAPILAAVVMLPDRTLYTVPSPWRWLMVLGQLGAAVALVFSVFQAGLLHFIGLAQLTARSPEQTGELQVRGLYRYVRHPLYLFSVLFIWLTPTVTRNFAVLYAGMTVYFIVGSFHEESLLVEEYGEAYRRYRRHVPRFIPVPGSRYRGEGEADPG